MAPALGAAYYELIDGEIRVLDPKEMPEAARRIESPYEVEARYSTKRSMGWVGYKVHLAETRDEGFPHLITDGHRRKTAICYPAQTRNERGAARRATGRLFLRLWE
jgi:transposase